MTSSRHFKKRYDILNYAKLPNEMPTTLYQKHFGTSVVGSIDFKDILMFQVLVG